MSSISGKTFTQVATTAFTKAKDVNNDDVRCFQAQLNRLSLSRPNESVGKLVQKSGNALSHFITSTSSKDFASTALQVTTGVVAVRIFAAAVVILAKGARAGAQVVADHTISRDKPTVNDNSKPMMNSGALPQKYVDSDHAIKEKQAMAEIHKKEERKRVDLEYAKTLQSKIKALPELLEKIRLKRIELDEACNRSAVDHGNEQASHLVDKVEKELKGLLTEFAAAEKFVNQHQGNQSKKYENVGAKDAPGEKRSPESISRLGDKFDESTDGNDSAMDAFDQGANSVKVEDDDSLFDAFDQGWNSANLPEKKSDESTDGNDSAMDAFDQGANSVKVEDDDSLFDAFEQGWDSADLAVKHEGATDRPAETDSPETKKLKSELKSKLDTISGSISRLEEVANDLTKEIAGHKELLAQGNHPDDGSLRKAIQVQSELEQAIMDLSIQKLSIATDLNKLGG